MALAPTPVTDNPFIPGFVAAYAYYPDQLIAGHHNLVTEPIVLGAGALQRGTVIGQQTAFSVVAAPGAANVGNGTIGNVAPGASAQTSSGSAILPPYRIVATAPTTFSVTDPEGNALPPATVGQAYASAELGFTIAAGGNAFAVGDSFSVTVLPGTGTFVACVRTATDGSQVPAGILVDTTDASQGPVRCGAYVAGEFNMNAIIADSSWTLPQMTQALRAAAIFLKAPISAADPT